MPKKLRKTARGQSLFSRRAAFVTMIATTISPLAAQPREAHPPTLELPTTEPATQPFALQFDLPSQITGRTYRIFLHQPLAPPPKDGWPAIYVLDSRSTFGTAASQVQLRTSNGQSGALVVGIGYPDPAAAAKLRVFDLTPSEPIPGPADRLDLKPGEAGGAALFHRFMMEELRPVIAAMAPVNRQDQSLIGYSLGGLFALGVLFEHPEAYHTIVAGSPSIWWNNRELLRKEAGFAAAVSGGTVSKRLLITSDECEQLPQDEETPSDRECPTTPLGTPASVTMVDDARGLAKRLAGLTGASGYQVSYVLFAGETHLTGIPASTSRGVAFTFARPNN